MPREAGHIVEKSASGNGRFAKPVSLLQMVFSDKGNKNDRLQDAESSTCRVSDSDPFVERIGQRLQDAVNHDPQERKGQLVFLVEFFQFLSSFR